MKKRERRKTENVTILLFFFNALLYAETIEEVYVATPHYIQVMLLLSIIRSKYLKKYSFSSLNKPLFIFIASSSAVEGGL